MKKIYNKIIVFIFVGFVSLTLVCSLIFGFNDIRGVLSENKDKLIDFKLTSSYFNNIDHELCRLYD